MKSYFFLLAILAFSYQSVHAQQPKNPVITYRNPVIAGDFADPSVIRVGDVYYAAGTSSEWGPAYPLYTSKNLVDWQYVGPVFQEMPGWTMGSYWAPELFHRNGTFYCYYTARRKSDKKSFIGVASTKDLTKGFKDHGIIIEWTNEAIDAFVVEDQGKLYITWKAYGLDKGKSIEILGSELSPDGLKLVGQEFSLIKADPAGWEEGGAEGQAIFKRGKYWYMLYSGNACCGSGCNYQVGFARAETLQGPWEKYSGNPMLFSDDTWKCPGHGTVVVTPDKRYFYLHHAYNAIGFTFTGRQGVLSELIWDEVTKWPSFRYGKTTPSQAEAPDLTARSIREKKILADYQRGEDPLPWVFDTRFPKPKFSTDRDALRIENTQQSLTGNFMGLVIKNGNYTFSTEVGISGGLAQHIMLYGDAENAIAFGVREHILELWQLRDGKKQVLHSRTIPEKYKVVELKLNSRYGQFFEFSWEVKGQKIDSLTTSTRMQAPWLPRWDRAPRVGVNVSGNGEGKSDFRRIEMIYE